MNDYKELIRRLKSAAERWEKEHPIIGVGRLRYCDALRDAADAIEQLVKERDELVTKLHQLEKERDSAVANLKNNGDCSFCKHEQVPIDNEPCNSCMYNGYESNFSNFEWRGVQEDNDEID